MRPWMPFQQFHRKPSKSVRNHLLSLSLSVLLPLASTRTRNFDVKNERSFRKTESNTNTGGLYGWEVRRENSPEGIFKISFFRKYKLEISSVLSIRMYCTTKTTHHHHQHHSAHGSTAKVSSSELVLIVDRSPGTRCVLQMSRQGEPSERGRFRSAERPCCIILGRKGIRTSRPAGYFTRITYAHSNLSERNKDLSVCTISRNLYVFPSSIDRPLHIPSRTL